MVFVMAIIVMLMLVRLMILLAQDLRGLFAMMTAVLTILMAPDYRCPSR